MIKQSQVCPKAISSCLLIALLVVPQSLQAKETKGLDLKMEDVLQKKINKLNSELDEHRDLSGQLRDQLKKIYNANKDLSIQAKRLRARINELNSYYNQAKAKIGAMTVVLDELSGIQPEKDTVKIDKELEQYNKDLIERITDLKKQLSQQQSDMEKQFLKEKDKYEDLLREQDKIYQEKLKLLDTSANHRCPGKQKDRTTKLEKELAKQKGEFNDGEEKRSALEDKLDDLKAENKKLTKAKDELKDQLKNPDNKVRKNLKNRIAGLEKELAKQKSAFEKRLAGEKEKCVKIMKDSENKIHTLNAKHKTARTDLLQDIEKENKKNEQLNKELDQLKKENSKLEKTAKAKDTKTLKEKLNKVNKDILGLREELLAEKKKIKTLVQDKIKAEKDFAEFKQEAQYFEDEMLRLKTKNDEEKKISEFYQQRLNEEKQERAKIEREIKTLKFESKPAEKTTD